MDPGQDLGVVDRLAEAARRAQCAVAQGEAARDVLVARERGCAHQAAAAITALADGASGAVDPALVLIQDAAFLRLLAALAQTIGTEHLTSQ